ncbi:MAG: hypothetical protein WBC05_16290 [Sedimentisphaerales bacterium]
MDHCKFCYGELHEVIPGVPPVYEYRVKCLRCGTYFITDRAFDAEPDNFVKERLYLISAVARWSSDRGHPIQIEQKLIKDRSEFEARILSLCPRGVQEKINHILAYIAEKASYPRDQIRIDAGSIKPLFYCKDAKEVESYLKHLMGSNLVEFSGPTIGTNRIRFYQLELTVEGWQKAEEQTRPNIESKQAFVAMRFNEEMNSAYIEGIKKLEEDTGFTMHRVDMEEFNDKICDKILADIRRSRFLIADITWHRKAVYFEAGFAKGLGLPVIWTCRVDQKDECDNNFDTRQYNHIFWKNTSELREKLKNRIVGTIGEAPK